MGTELKPCPFCGSGAEWIKIHEASAPFVRCLECWGECCPDGWDTRPGEDAATARAEAAEQRAEAAEAALAQARADRALLTGLWLATAPPDVLPALLPVDPGDRDRLAAALDAVDLQASAGSHTAAGRAIIARIVAETAGGAR